MRKIIIFLLASLLCFSVYAAVTKSGATVDAWQNIAANSVLEGATSTITGNYQTNLVVAGTLNSTTATTNGLKIIVQVSAATSGNNTWYTLTEFGALSGVTAGSVNGTNSMPSGWLGGNVINCTTTAGLANSTWLFVSGDTLATSELVFQTSRTAVGVGNITLLNLPEQTHTANYTVWNQTFSQTISIPDVASRVRVIYDNKQDATGSAAIVTSSILNITGI